MQNFMGLSGYVWWQGVVEDRQDPLELGRARVRILGFHTEEKSKIPTDSLPWAYPAMPLNSTPGSIPNLKEGMWVMGFFRDGENAQEPVMTHTIDAGYVNNNNPNKGFNDPETNTFRPSKPVGADSVVGEVNTTKLARGITDGTIRDDSDIARVYPYNHVSESESGHVMEINDSPGSESLSITHRTGTYGEIAQDGDMTVKVVGNNFEVVAKDKYVTVDEDMNVTIGGNVTNNIEGNKIEKTYSMEMNSESEVNINSAGSVKISAPTVFIDGNLSVSGMVSVGGSTVITGKHVRTGSMSVSDLSPASTTYTTGPSPVGAPIPLVLPVITSNHFSGALAEGVNAPSTALSTGANLLSENMATLRKLEESLQSAEQELEMWSDLSAELTTRLNALRSKYGIEQ